MEYDALVDSAAYGSFSETDFIDELLVEGCWVETTVGCGSYNWGTDPYLALTPSKSQIFQEESDPEPEGFVAGKRWWIGPRSNPGPSSSVKERLVVAVGCLKEYTKNTDVLIQIWVPLLRGVLNTHAQGEGERQDYPCALEYNYPRAFHFQDPNVNIRFFGSHEFYEQQCQYDVRGSLALPIFERGTGTCLGVVEIVMTDNSELGNVCHALEGVDFRNSCVFIPPAVKGFKKSYQAAVNEIVEVLTCVCKTHNLPLALTWAPCIQQGKSGCGHSNDENYVSIVDAACFVWDLDILGFQEACCEYHLLGGQGIVGTALATTQPCFANDITAFSKAEYPLAHYANMFGLHAAVAIPLRTGSADFVLEFFLPKDCHDSQEQKEMLNSLSMLVQQACRSLHVITVKEIEEEFTLPVGDGSKESSSWIAHMMEAQAKQKGKGVSVSLEYLQKPKQEFKVTTNFEQSSGCSRGSVAGGGRRSSSGGRKPGDKRRTKAEKTIGLPVLRQYFAGSLKDAAKSIGVCPTTLKRICRQQGITRWPSRKIKKVGHSLRKLQLVIDSVQGAEGAIQIGSFYTIFPELSSKDFSANGFSESSKVNDHNSKQMHPFSDNGLYNQGATPLKSPPSSCSQTPTISCATAGNQLSTVINNCDILLTDRFLKRAHSEAKASIQVQDTQHPISLEALPPLPQTCVWNTGAFRVKVTFGDEKIRFRLQQNWGLRDLQLEIARRFNLNEVTNIHLKYLDDAREWVLLTCDADLEECKDIYRSSQSRTIRLFLFQASPLNHANIFGGGSPS